MTPEESIEIIKCTSLWQRTLGKEDPHVMPLRESFLRSRENAAFLLAKIRKDFPDLTIHDITHVDSLWRVADTIIGPKYHINPLEGYILGIAFLTHDAALSYDTVDGIDALRNTTEWKDFHSDEHDGKVEEEFKKECDFVTIRALHAKKAGEMLTKMFTRGNGTTFYLIDNDSFRTHYGELTGKIAESHHWDIDRVKSDLGIQEPPLDNMPVDWEINSQKLACILRCADAGHIDNGRAPDNIYFDRSLVINKVSRDYWTAQNHLGQLRVDRTDNSKLLVKSTNPFPKSEFAAWNVAFEAVVQLDREIRRSNELLKSLSTDTENLVFPRVGVEGSGSKEMLAKHIKTIGWNPCDMNVHTSNVKALIEHLGGSKLYGEKNILLVALRELIQNARDAIHARRTLDPEHFGIDDGKITIRLKEQDGKRIIEVEDNGIGMSRDCIKNHLLDFGSSYWNSALSVMENPGLRGKGFTSVGKFGIGFYSTFMVAKSVTVITRRYSQGENANKVEFPNGLTLSPILSSYSLSTEVSTIVRFELKDNIELTFDTITREDDEWNPFDLAKALSILTIGLDVDLYFKDGNDLSQVHQNVASEKFKNDSEEKKKWLSRLFLWNVPKNIDEISSKLEELTDEHGKLRGWVLSPEWIIKMEGCDFSYFTGKLFPMVETIGGLSSMMDLKEVYDSDKGFLGYIDGIDNGISRDKILKDETLRKCLQEWTKKNFKKNYDEILKSNDLSIEYERLVAYTGLLYDISKDKLDKETLNIMKNLTRTEKDLHNLIKMLLPSNYLDEIITSEWDE